MPLVHGDFVDVAILVDPEGLLLEADLVPGSELEHVAIVSCPDLNEATREGLHLTLDCAKAWVLQE